MTESEHDHRGHGNAMASKTDNGATDPVCGMTVDPHTTQHRHTHQGRTYYFCSAGCQSKFVAQPAKYLTELPAAAQALSAGTIYTCPMHPQIRQAGPGNCPICGMTLEPVVATAGAGPNPELIDMTRRFWIGLVLAIPVMALEMGGHLTNLHMVLGQNLSNWIQHHVQVGQMAAHLQRHDRDGQHKADPEPASHIDKLRIGAGVCRCNDRLQRHSADRAIAGAGLPNLRMHRAGVDRSR